MKKTTQKYQKFQNNPNLSNEFQIMWDGLKMRKKTKKE
jgi:hypothetical protein